MTSRRAGAVVLAAALAVGVAGCGDDDDGGASIDVTTTESNTTTTTTTSTTAPTTESTAASDPLPPPGALDIEPLYGEALAELGLKLTERGGLIDRSGGGYYPSDTGTHLALYVEPIDDRTVPQYIDGIRSVAVVFGDVFDRWPELESYDVCQEPEDDGGEAEPLPVTQIELTRAEADAIDWATVTVVDLVRASRADPRGLALRVSSRLANDPAFEAIVNEAT